MRLKQTLDFKDATFLGLGAIIGAGIFVVVGVTAGMAGPAVIVSMLVAALVALLTAFNFADLSRAIPKEGAGYAFANELISPFAGYLAGWLWIASNTIAGAVLALGFASYASQFLPGVPVQLLAGVGIAVLAAVNLAGTRRSAALNNLLVIVKVGVLLVFVSFGIFSLKISNFQPFAPNGTTGILSAAAYIFFAYIGFARIATVAEEVKDPAKTIPRSIFASLGISTLLYLLVGAVAVGMVGHTALAESASPLADAMKATGNPALVGVLVAGGLIATASVLLTGILGVSRVMFAMARDGMLPSMFSKVSQLQTPHWAIIAASLAMLALVFLDFLRLAALTGFASLAYYSISNYASLRLPSRKSLAKKAVSWAALASCLLLIPFLGAEAMIDGTIVLLVGLAYYVLVPAKNEGRKPGAESDRQLAG